MNWLWDPNARWILGGCMLLGLSSGVLGSFAFLRKRSLLGDALAHAALPGVCLAFIITGSRSLGGFLVGAALAGLVGAACIQVITRYSRVKEDAALGLVLSVFFGFGIVLLTLIQQSQKASQAGLDKLVFGQAAAMVSGDVQTMAICAGVVCLATFALFKEFKLLCFDPGFARGLGYPTALLDGLLMLLIVLAVVVGLQAVGVVLMAAMLITPAAAARLWTDRLDHMVVFAGLFGALSGAIGTGLSTMTLRMPTGPLIVLAATSVFAVSLVAAPRKGLIARWVRLIRLRRQVAREHALRSLYELAESRSNWTATISVADLAASRGNAESGLRRVLGELGHEGLVRVEGGSIALTESGLNAAYQVARNHRLWEMFLMHEGQLGADHVDRDADVIEHLLPRPIVEELERLLVVHGRHPELPPSVHPLRSV